MFIWMQKISFNVPSFSRYYKDIATFFVVVVAVVVDGGGTLCMSGYSHQKQWYYFVEDFDIYLPAKNHYHSSVLSRDIAKILQTCYFRYFGHTGPRPSKTIISTCRITCDCYLRVTNQLDPLLFTWDMTL